VSPGQPGDGERRGGGELARAGEEGTVAIAAPFGSGQRRWRLISFGSGHLGSRPHGLGDDGVRFSCGPRAAERVGKAAG
jgi:hypothetical protein